MKAIFVFVTSLTLLLESVVSAAQPTILFVRKGGKGFDEVFNVMEKDLAKKYKISDYIIEKSTAYQAVKEKIQDIAPKLLVMMDNQSLNYAMKYNDEQAESSRKLQGVALMGLNLKTILKENKQFSGIAYEVPAYSLLTQFRFIAERPIKNVLVFYRQSLFRESVESAQKQLSIEGIKLYPVNVEQEGKSKEEVERFLINNLKKHVLAPGKYDAVWVMLDSGLLNQKLFQEVWLPVAQEAKIPFLSGAEELVKPETNFATFVITPNLSDLANQGVQQVEAILGDQVSPKDLGTEELISVNKILNRARARAIGIGVKENNLSEVKLLE